MNSVKNKKIEHIAIACCTYMRPLLLEKVLKNLKNISIPANIKLDLIIVDNDKNGSAKSIIKKFESDYPINLHYYIEPNNGISSARNRLLKEAQMLGASHIAMFDDDGLPEKDWLINHIKFYEEHNDIDISSGPQFSYFDEKVPNFIKSNFLYKRKTTQREGKIKQSCATNNVFFPLYIVQNKQLYFDEKYNHTGGEDGHFFSKATSEGYVIGFNPNSIVYEIVDKKRANILYIITKSFHIGYTNAVLKLNDCKLTAKISYTFKYLAALFLDIILIIFSLFCGFTTTLNILGLTFKTLGKISGAIFSRPFCYYSSSR